MASTFIEALLSGLAGGASSYAQELRDQADRKERDADDARFEARYKKNYDRGVLESDRSYDFQVEQADIRRSDKLDERDLDIDQTYLDREYQGVLDRRDAKQTEFLNSIRSGQLDLGVRQEDRLEDKAANPPRNFLNEMLARAFLQGGGGFSKEEGLISPRIGRLTPSIIDSFTAYGQGIDPADLQVADPGRGRFFPGINKGVPSDNSKLVAQLKTMGKTKEELLRGYDDRAAAGEEMIISRDEYIKLLDEL